MSIRRRELLLAGSAAMTLGGCANLGRGSLVAANIDVFDPAISDVIDLDAPMEELGRGYTWCEGPTWDRDRDALYFTDVPGNVAYKWTAVAGVEVFLAPSGALEPLPGFREPGANGLWYARDGSLIICNHGSRAVERMNLDTRQRERLTDQYAGKPFNSPNDIVEARNGALFFTDPPYGLEGLDTSPLKEQDSNGVYCLQPDGHVRRLISDMTFPNGIALSPDGTRLYVSQSDPDASLIRELTLSAGGAVSGDRLLFDARPYQADNVPGLPDGMAVSVSGVIFATGPGGVLILSSEGHLLGRINTGRATANCAFGEDGHTLFMTAHDRLLKIRTKSRGVQWS